MRQWKNSYTPGTYKRECDKCGWDYLRVQMKREWNGLIVCADCFDPRHPSTYPRPQITERPIKVD